MTITIPTWVLWALGGTAAIIIVPSVLFLAWFGYMALTALGGLKR